MPARRFFYFVAQKVALPLKVIRRPDTQVSLIGFVENTEVDVFARKAGLEFRGAVICPEEIEFEAGPEITGYRPASKEVHVQENRNLKS